MKAAKASYKVALKEYRKHTRYSANDFDQAYGT